MLNWDDLLPIALTTGVALVAALVTALALAVKAIVDTRRLEAQFVALSEKFLLLDHLLADDTDYDSLRPDVWRQAHPEAIRQYRAVERRDRADRKQLHRANRRNTN